MTQYLLSVHGRTDNPYTDEADMQAAFAAVEAFNQDLQQNGQWVFACGLMPADTATVVRTDSGDTTMTDGPYLETKEHLGGFWVVEASDLDQALALAATASVACKNPVEVRPLQAE